jgi:hypothetical protein
LDIMGESGQDIYSGPAITDELDKLLADDGVLLDAVLDPDVSLALLLRNPVLWARCAIGADIGRGASSISDRELAVRYSGGGFAEWDPRVAQAVRDYLHEIGYIGLPSSS